MKTKHLKFSRATKIDRTPVDDVCRSNLRRAKDAQRALIGWAGAAMGNDAADDAADFLSDLMHLCRMNHMDFDSLLDRARGYHETERKGG